MRFSCFTEVNGTALQNHERKPRSALLLDVQKISLRTMETTGREVGELKILGSKDVAHEKKNVSEIVVPSQISHQAI